MITYSQGMHNSLCFATYYKLVKYILVGKRCISCARLKLVIIKASTRTFIVSICNSCFGCYCLKLFSDWYEVVHQIVLMNYLPSETFVSKPRCIHLSVFLCLQNHLSNSFLDFVAYFLCLPFLMKDRVRKKYFCNSHSLNM